MSDLGYAFTLYFATLGPLKTVPAFYLATQGADRKTVVTLAARSTALATAIVLFIAVVASGTLSNWRVSVDAVAIAGGLLLLITSIRILAEFNFAEGADAGEVRSVNLSTRWMGRPVLSPLTIPAIVPPIGVVVVLYFAGTALGDMRLQAQLVGLLLAIMAGNFVAMIFARPIMRIVGLPVLQVVGWVFAALQAGLAIQVIVNAFKQL